MNALRLVAVAGCLAASACTHVVHTADVKPGVSMSLMGGAGAEWLEGEWRWNPSDAETPQARFAPAWDVAVSLGYGWRLTDELGISTSITVPYGHRPDDKTYGLAGVALDTYLQLLHTPLDLGVGVQLGNATGVYVEAGHGWDLEGGPELRVDGGLRLAVIAGSLEDQSLAVIPFALFTARGDEFYAGLWADTWIMAPPLYRCGEACFGPYQPAAFALMGGAVVGFNYDSAR